VSVCRKQFSVAALSKVSFLTREATPSAPMMAVNDSGLLVSDRVADTEFSPSLISSTVHLPSRQCSVVSKIQIVRMLTHIETPLPALWPHP